MRFVGQETFSQPQGEIWDKVSDLQFMAQLMDSDQLLCRVKPKFAFLAGSLQLRFTVLERDPPNHLKMSIVGKKIGAGLTLEVTISLAMDPLTCLTWEGEVQRRTGLLKPIGNSLIQGAAENIIATLWASFRQALSDENQPG
jgi:carbon monoxide dehydrogenase subunit G